MGSFNEIKFTKSVIKQFHKLIECPISMMERVELLENMEDMFTVPLFGLLHDLIVSLVYENEEKQILGMKYLLGTWEVLMDGLENVFLFAFYHSSCERAIAPSSIVSLRRSSTGESSFWYVHTFAFIQGIKWVFRIGDDSIPNTSSPSEEVFRAPCTHQHTLQGNPPGSLISHSRSLRLQSPRACHFPSSHRPQVHFCRDPRHLPAIIGDHT